MPKNVESAGFCDNLIYILNETLGAMPTEKSILPPLYRLVSSKNISYGFCRGDIVSVFDEIGNSIVLLRKHRGFTQEHLALECEMSISYLRRIEHGTANPTIKELQHIADILGTELENPLCIPETVESAK